MPEPRIGRPGPMGRLFLISAGFFFLGMVLRLSSRKNGSMFGSEALNHTFFWGEDDA